MSRFSKLESCECNAVFSRLLQGRHSKHILSDNLQSLGSVMCAGVSLLVLIVCDSALTAGGRKRKQNRVGSMMGHFSYGTVDALKCDAEELLKCERPVTEAFYRDPSE
ncbi:unnamed protein product [Leuciscus chuanchicus]